jgi:uncharacterized phage protein gp47/JayE
MPFSRPALADLRTQARSDLVSRFTSLDNQLVRSIVNAIADMTAGMVWLLYGYLSWLATQLLPDTAVGPYLQRWLNIKGIVTAGSTAAVLNYAFTGTINGTDIPAGTVLQRGDGVLFTTNADVSIASLAAAVAITAQNPGSAGNSTSGTILTLVTAISGVVAQGTVGSTVTNGADAETPAQASSALLLALRTPAQGGNRSDYLKWVNQAGIGATRAWVLPLAGGAGTVTVLFCMDNAGYGPLPSSGDISAMQSYLNGVAPVTAVVTAGAPGETTQNFRITNLTVQAGFVTATVQANIKAALADLFAQLGTAQGGTIQLQAMSDAITRAGGVAGFDLVTPSADLTTSSGNIPVTGTFTWV